MAETTIDYTQLIITIFSVLLGVLGVLTMPIICLFGLIMALAVLLVQVTNGSITDPLLLSFTIASIVICVVCFAVAWSKR